MVKLLQLLDDIFKDTYDVQVIKYQAKFTHLSGNSLRLQMVLKLLSKLQMMTTYQNTSGITFINMHYF